VLVKVHERHGPGAGVWPRGDQHAVHDVAGDAGDEGGGDEPVRGAGGGEEQPEGAPAQCIQLQTLQHCPHLQAVQALQQNIILKGLSTITGLLV
jgi:hypothetical protein